MGEVTVIGSVGGSDQCVVRPGHDVHDSTIVGAREDQCPITEADVISLYHQVGALRYNDIQRWGPVDGGGGEGTRCHNHGPGFDSEVFVGGEVRHRDGVPILQRVDRCRPCTVDGYRSKPVDCGPGDGDHQPGIVGPGVGIDEARLKTFVSEVRNDLLQFVHRDPPMSGTGPVESTQEVIQQEPGPQGQRCSASLGCPGGSVGQADMLVDRDHELERFEQIVGDLGQDLLLSQPFGYELELELGQVPNPAVEELGRPPGGPGREVVLFDQGNPEPSGRNIEGSSATDDTAANHQNVKAASVGQHPKMFGSGPATGGRGHRLRLGRLVSLTPGGKIPGPPRRGGLQGALSSRSLTGWPWVGSWWSRSSWR